MEVGEFQRYILDTVFPDAISTLELCKTTEEVSSWKKTFLAQIANKKVEGEESSV
jgi:hypothetical protein